MNLILEVPVRLITRFVPCLFLFAGMLNSSLSIKADEPVAPGKAIKRPVKAIPESIQDLRDLQARVKAVIKKVTPATVGLRVGGASGSGVIINKEGLILTAGHVAGRNGVPVTIIMPDGKRVKGVTLGADRGIDSGMVKITDKGDYPFAELGEISKLKRGQWCLAIGHPGGYKKGRDPVVRLGRIQDIRSSYIRTDCALVGGDSGGPLFDLDGKVIGIHSRIGLTMSQNMHVPIDTYQKNRDRLVKGEVWGGRFGLNMRRSTTPFLGVKGDLDAKSCRIAEVLPRTPAARAGLKDGDIILEFGGKKMKRYEDLRPAIRAKKVGDKVKLLVKRGKETLNLELVLGRS